MKASKWQLQRQIEQRYAHSIKSLTKQLFRHINNIDDPYEIIKILNHMSSSKAYKQHCENIAYRMVTMISQENCKSWREAALKSTRGFYTDLSNILKNSKTGLDVTTQTQINAGYIQTLPTNIAFEITEFVQLETFKGTRSTEIAKHIKAIFPEKSKANASLIARTEVSKTQCALTKARAESLGLDWYIWRTSEDSRVRNSHEIMEGVLVRWNDPPSPERLKGEKRTYGNYHAGNIFNCRCYSEPVIDFNYMQFPCDVYCDGRIKNMKKAEFLQVV